MISKFEFEILRARGQRQILVVDVREIDWI